MTIGLITICTTFAAMTCADEEIPAAKELPLFPTSPGIYQLIGIQNVTS